MKNKYIVLEKLYGKFRQDMLVGDRSVQGYCLELPKIGYPFYLYNSLEDINIGGATIPKEDLVCDWTSQVREIDLDNQIIKTANSVYKFEIKEL